MTIPIKQYKPNQDNRGHETVNQHQARQDNTTQVKTIKYNIRQYKARWNDMIQYKKIFANIRTPDTMLQYSTRYDNTPQNNINEDN